MVVAAPAFNLPAPISSSCLFHQHRPSLSPLDQEFVLDCGAELGLDVDDTGKQDAWVLGNISPVFPLGQLCLKHCRQVYCPVFKTQG